MNSKPAFKQLGGYSCFISGCLLFIGHFINLFGQTDYGTVLGSSLIFPAHILIVFAFIGLYEGQGTERSLLSTIGMITSVLGTIISSCIIFDEIAGASGKNVEAIFNSVVVNPIYTYGPLLFVIGMVLFGISSMMTKNPTRFGGFLLILGMLIFGAGSFSGKLHLIVELIGAAVTAIAFIWCGIKVLSQKNSLSYGNSVGQHTDFGS